MTPYYVHQPIRKRAPVKLSKPDLMRVNPKKLRESMCLVGESKANREIENALEIMRKHSRVCLWKVPEDQGKVDEELIAVDL